jgi:hypothetical protein
MPVRDMDGMAGWKGIERFSRKRHAVKVPADHQTVETILVEDRLQEMRQQRNGDRREQDVVAVGAILRASMPAVEPPACGERANDMLVGAPGEDLRNLLDFRTGAVRNPLRDFDVGPGWPYAKQRHRPPLSQPE